MKSTITLHNTVEQIDSEQWENLALKSVNTSFFQTKKCYDFYTTLSFLKPFVYGVSEDGRLVGVICGYIIAEGNAIKQYFSKRAIVPGGVILNEDVSNEALNALLELTNIQLSRKVIYIEIRNYTDYSFYKNIFQSSGFVYHAHLNFHVVTPDIDTALKNLSTTKRRDIKLSKKEGAEWYETTKLEDIISYYELLKNLYSTKIKLPLFPHSFFENLVLSGSGKLFVVKYDGKVIGGSVCVLSPKKAVFEWFVCGLDGHIKNIFPSTIATWAGIEYAALNGYERFDMMGAGKPDDGYGVRDFKSKFGGELVEHGRFLKVNYKFLYLLGEKFIKITSSKLSVKTNIKPVVKQYRVETDSSKIDKNKWREFVFNHPNGNVFQTPKIFDLYLQTPRITPIIIVALDTNGEIVGCLLSYIQREYNGLLGELTVRSIALGAPLVKNNQLVIADLLLNEYEKLCKTKVIYSQFRNLNDINHFNPIFKKYQYILEPHLDTLIDLRQERHQLWSNLHKERRRNIAKAEKVGLEFRVLSSDNEVYELVKLLKMTYERIRVPLSDEQLFIHAKTTLTEKVVFFGAYDADKLVAGQIRLTFKKSMYAWFAGSDSSAFSKRPNDFLTWRVLLWAKENQFEVFDFGGAGRPGHSYGVRDYKLKYGGSVVDYGRYEKIHRPILMYLGKIGYKLYQYSRWSLSLFFYFIDSYL